MKIVNTEDVYRVHSSSLRVYDELPAKTYVLEFHQMNGFSLKEQPNIIIKDPKIYGVLEDKVAKVLKSFAKVERSFGVLLSGDKGIGKSLFASILCKTALEQYNLPVIIVNNYYNNIATFIQSIDQPVIILLDEFDKEFDMDVNAENSQCSLLPLFDGITNSKKLFIATCNHVHKVNEYFINRPGRFHYHFRFDYPVGKEVEVYLKDNVDKQYWSEISKVVEFSKKINLNYDCLRAIAFELNIGESFEDFIDDLNIKNMSTPLYYVNLYCKDGKIVKDYNISIDLFGITDTQIQIEDKDTRYLITFNPRNIKVISSSSSMILAEKDVSVTATGCNVGTIGYDNFNVLVDRIEILTDRPANDYAYNL